MFFIILCASCIKFMVLLKKVFLLDTNFFQNSGYLTNLHLKIVVYLYVQVNHKVIRHLIF